VVKYSAPVESAAIELTWSFTNPWEELM